jgi:hypothetical protein
MFWESPDMTKYAPVRKYISLKRTVGQALG